MVRFLSPEWIDLLDASVQGGDGLDRPNPDLSLIVEQQITHPDGAITQYQVVFADGTVRVRPGAEGQADVRFIQDLATAVGIAQGTASAQRAFMTGHLQVGGDLRVLSDNGDVLDQLSDAFASVRTATTYDDPDRRAGNDGAADRPAIDRPTIDQPGADTAPPAP